MHFKSVILYFLLVATKFILSKKANTTVEDIKKGNCSCGGYPTETPQQEDLPIISQSSGLAVQCDEIGAELCKSLCLALATAAKVKGPEVICGKIVNANELKLSAFYKICEGQWVFTGMTSDRLLCCEDSKAKVCPCHEAENASIAETPKVTLV